VKLFRVFTVQDGRWRGAIILARDESEAISDPCLLQINPKTQSGESKYQATEIFHANLDELEAAHHCPRFVWSYDDSVSTNAAFRELEYRQRHLRKPVDELRMPEIVGLAPTSKCLARRTKNVS